jgi:23S rRNA (adenine2030-N6)-methyltransferase
MNYRHAFHAGNFADVVKHAVLARILTYLHGKPSPFRVIDTHAGAGIYDLAGEEAQRGGEWQDGIGRLATATLSREAQEFVRPYLAIVSACNEGSTVGRLARYPGSPLIARDLLREQDRLVACEVEPSAFAGLSGLLRRDRRTRAVNLDGWTALGAFVPPRERRGVVLIDPPFEARDEFARMADGFATAYRKWPTGIFLLWYPVKDRPSAAAFEAHVAELTTKSVCIDMAVAAGGSGRGLVRSDLIIVNPPWVLEEELGTAMPELCRVLARDRHAACLLRSRSD